MRSLELRDSLREETVREHGRGEGAARQVWSVYGRKMDAERIKEKQREWLKDKEMDKKITMQVLRWTIDCPGWIIRIIDYPHPWTTPLSDLQYPQQQRQMENSNLFSEGGSVEPMGLRSMMLPAYKVRPELRVRFNFIFHYLLYFCTEWQRALRQGHNWSVAFLF